MGRPPSNGGPAFRFNQTEVTEMETILQDHNTQMPAREVLVALAEKFSNSEERSGKIVVQMKQVWNWFQNRRYAIRAKAAKAPGKLSVSPMPRDDSTVVRNVPQAPQSIAAPSAIQSAGRIVSDNSQMEFEAKSARDGAWYDVANFLSHRSLETLDPDVLVRFAGFGPEEDEWVNVRKHVRQRSLPCESSECVAVLPGDLILCFQEGKEQALYFDAHVLDAQRRRHDVRGCRCRFLVRYVHDQSEEIVPLRKVCRRPETDYRLQQLHAINDSASVNQQKTGADPHTVNTLRVYPPTTEPMQKKQKTEERRDASATVTSTTHGNVPVSTETKVPQLKFTKISIGGNAETSMVLPANVAVTSGTETRVLQPKFTETSTASIMKTIPPAIVAVSTVPPANVAVRSGTKTEVPQPKFTEISIGGNGDTSMVPPTSVAMVSGTETEVPQPTFTKISAGGNAETSMVPPVNVAVTGGTETEVPQSKCTEISAGGNAETSMVPPTNVAVTSGTETEVPQPEFTEINTDGNVDTSTVPTANVIVTTSMAPPLNVAVTSSTETEVPQPKFTEVSTTGNEETSMAPEANIAVTSDAATSTVTSDSGQNISRS